MRIALVLASTLFLSSIARADWLAQEVGSHNFRLACATSGKVNGIPVLILCGEDGSLQEYRWKTGRWVNTARASGLRHPASAVLLNRDNGGSRLLVGSRFEKPVIEHALSSSGKWLLRNLEFPGFATVGLAASQSLSDPTSDFVVATRTIQRDAPSRENVFGQAHDEHFVCRNRFGRIACDPLQQATMERIVTNPPGWHLKRDTILSSNVFQLIDGKWQAGPKLPMTINAAPSRLVPRRVYFDSDVAALNYDLTKAETAPIGSSFNRMTSRTYGASFTKIVGAYSAMAVSLAETRGAEAVLAADDEYLQRFVGKSDSGMLHWTKQRMFKLDGDVEGLISADLRGDGIERIYIVENFKDGSKGHVLELTYFPRQPRIAIAPLSVVDLKSGKREQNTILPEVISQEFVTTGAIKVVEEEQREAVDRERLLNAALCVDDLCRSKFARSANVDYLVIPSIVHDNSILRFEIEIFGADGRLKKSIVREVDKATGLIATTRQCAVDAIRAWSESPNL